MSLPNLIYFLPTYIDLQNDVSRQKVFIKNVLEADIVAARTENDGSLDDEDFTKIRKYYGFGVPAIVGEGFCALRGQTMTATERLTSTYQGALTGLYDDFFDKTLKSAEDIRAMMDDPANFHPASSLEKLFIHFLRKVHAGIPDKAFFSAAFDKVYQAQLDTGRQLSPSISWDEIREITFRKGGVSLLFYRSAFTHVLQSGEEKALYEAGGLMQLGNDIFDVYKDEKQGIRTFLTACEHIGQVREEFNTQLRKTLSSILEINYPQAQQKRYLQKLLLGISRCWVCLDKLEKLEVKSGGYFRPAGYSREEMICDMEIPANMLRSIKYYLSYHL